MLLAKETWMKFTVFARIHFSKTFTKFQSEMCNRWNVPAHYKVVTLCENIPVGETSGFFRHHHLGLSVLSELSQVLESHHHHHWHHPHPWLSILFFTNTRSKKTNERQYRFCIVSFRGKFFWQYQFITDPTVQSEVCTCNTIQYGVATFYNWNHMKCTFATKCSWTRFS